MYIYGMISDIQRFSLNDGPGIRTTVFLKGCPLKCSWCHNPETKNYFSEVLYRAVKCIGCGKCLAACPIPGAILTNEDGRINRSYCIGCQACTVGCSAGALISCGHKVTVEEIIAEVLKDLRFYRNSGGGMTLSGGEPLAQADFASALLEAAQLKGVHTCLDTSGYATESAWEKVLPFLDMVLYDIKFLDPAQHKKYIGVSNELILENLKQITSRVEVRIRIPLIPGINDHYEFIEAVGILAQSVKVKNCDILPYHDYALSKYRMLGRTGRFYRADALAPERIQSFKERLEKMGLQVTIGG